MPNSPSLKAEIMELNHDERSVFDCITSNSNVFSIVSSSKASASQKTVKKVVWQNSLKKVLI